MSLSIMLKFEIEIISSSYNIHEIIEFFAGTLGNLFKFGDPDAIF